MLILYNYFFHQCRRKGGRTRAIFLLTFYHRHQLSVARRPVGNLQLQKKCQRKVSLKLKTARLLLTLLLPPSVASTQRKLSGSVSVFVCKCLR